MRMNEYKAFICITLYLMKLMFSIAFIRFAYLRFPLLKFQAQLQLQSPPVFHGLNYSQDFTCKTKWSKITLPLLCLFLYLQAKNPPCAKIIPNIRKKLVFLAGRKQSTKILVCCNLCSMCGDCDYMLLHFYMQAKMPSLEKQLARASVSSKCNLDLFHTYICRQCTCTLIWESPCKA